MEQNIDVLEDINDALAAMQGGTDETDYRFNIDVLQAILAKVTAIAGKQYELIESITLTEDTASVSRSAEPDGTEYNFEKVYIEFSVPETSATAQILVRFNGESDNHIRVVNAMATSERDSVAYGRIENGLLIAYAVSGAAAGNGTQLYGVPSTGIFLDTISEIEMVSNLANVPMPSGTKIDIYAVRV